MYKFLRNLLFLFPAEGVHHFSMKGLKILCSLGLIKKGIAACCRPAPDRSPTQNAGQQQGGKPPQNAGRQQGGRPPQGIARDLFGLRFRNPVGLGAGFDKNALYLEELEALGFGFVEIGTVTPLAQAGNEQPRLFRLPMDQALINRMGFNNDGAAVIAERLQKWRKKNPLTPLIVGGNIGKNKSTPNEEAWKDYERCFRALFRQVDYFVVNVSSPNTPGLRELQEKDALRRILVNLQSVNTELAAKINTRSKPLLLKIAPDLNGQQLDELIALSLEIGLDGLVAANTTISREKLLTPPAELEAIGAGGLSGAPLKGRSTSIVKYIQGKTGGSIPLIASGGIFTGEDAKEKLQTGASLVQVWTGFIYEGPFIVSRICRKL